MGKVFALTKLNFVSLIWAYEKQPAVYTSDFGRPLKILSENVRAKKQREKKSQLRESMADSTDNLQSVTAYTHTHTHKHTHTHTSLAAITKYV